MTMLGATEVYETSNTKDRVRGLKGIKRTESDTGGERKLGEIMRELRTNKT